MFVFLSFSRLCIMQILAAYQEFTWVEYQKMAPYSYVALYALERFKIQMKKLKLNLICTGSN